MLRSKNVEFEEVDVTDDPARRTEMEKLSKRRTVPQIFIDGTPIGGYDDARRLEAKGVSWIACLESKAANHLAREAVAEAMRGPFRSKRQKRKKK